MYSSPSRREMTKRPSLERLNSIPLCMYHICFIHLSVHRRDSIISTTVNKVVINTGGQISLGQTGFISFGNICSRNARAHGNFSFNFLKNLYAFFPEMTTLVYIPIIGTQGFSSLHYPHQHLLPLITAIPTVVMWYLTVVSICISRMIIDIEQFLLIAVGTNPKFDNG